MYVHSSVYVHSSCVFMHASVWVCLDQNFYICEKGPKEFDTIIGLLNCVKVPFASFTHRSNIRVTRARQIIPGQQSSSLKIFSFWFRKISDQVLVLSTVNSIPKRQIFRLVETESICRQQFKCGVKLKFCL